MGIVIDQSIRNTIVTYIGFAIGAVNALFMYPIFLGDTFYGLTAFLLSSANILMPLMAFGVHNTIVKFYSGYKTEQEKSRFLSFMLVLPLVLIVPISLLGLLFYRQIALSLSDVNPVIYDYVWLIPIIGLCMGYFEIFYAWVKVHFRSIAGNFMKEVLLRIFISALLFAVYFDVITPVEFIYATTGAYLLTTLLMGYFAMKIKQPDFSFQFPADKKPLLTYSFFIILSGSVATLLLDIDKFMLAQYINVDNIAYYSVAIFIATVVAVPSRAMHQITYPITARLMSEGKHDELNDLYKKTSVTLQIVGGYVLLGILVNIKQLYLMLPAEYSLGTTVVFLIGISRYFELILGNNNAIIFNSKYYKTVLVLGLILAILAIGLNAFCIPYFGIDGAAIATLVSIMAYSTAKLMFVVTKMDLFPFTKKTLYTLIFGVMMFISFYFWDFKYSPVVNIILKSILLSVVYAYLTYILHLSDDVNAVMKKVGSYLRRPHKNS